MDLIKGKYKSADIIKSKDGKIVEKAHSTTGTKSVVLKSYPADDAKSIQH
jgi:hypothetical protein